MNAVLLLLAALSFQEPVERSLYLRPEVKMERIDGRPWFTVRAQNASVEEIIAELASASDREVQGFDTLERSALVTVDLEQRPLDVVLEYTLGSIGIEFELRRDRIIISPGAPENLGTDESLERASFAWVRAATRFPDHPEAATARLAQGEIAELRGLLGPARDHYLTLIERYPKSPLAAEAYMRAGRVSARLGTGAVPAGTSARWRTWTWLRSSTRARDSSGPRHRSS